MIHPNPFLVSLNQTYLFQEINNRKRSFLQENPGADLISLGIGDVTQPIPAVCARAMHDAIDKMAHEAVGYDPGLGRDFLRKAIAEKYHGVSPIRIEAADICVTHGAKFALASFLSALDYDTRVAIPDPVYPAYRDANFVAGHTDGGFRGHSQITYLPCTAENGFAPVPPEEAFDLIYLCNPANPTGAVMNREQLDAWIEYAFRKHALIFYDAAYESFIRSAGIPHSIYELTGATDVAVEFCSFSKSAGFTDMTCGWTVVPSMLKIRGRDTHETHPLNKLWHNWQNICQNGVAYHIQRAAEAALTPQGKVECKMAVDIYLDNADLILKAFRALGFECYGGENAPYVWINVREDSWEFFDRLLRGASIVTTPGAGFGSNGEGYIRVSAFNLISKVDEAMDRIKALLG